jgi:uncharacterized integral membrane protein
MHEHQEHSAEPYPGDRAEGRKTTTTLIILIVIVAVAATFIIQNSDKATIRFLFISVTTRIWAGFLIALGLGVVVAWLSSMWWRRRQQS